MRGVVLALIASTALVSPALAEQDPRSCGRDARVVCVPYVPNDVVKVLASPTRATTIIFGSDETVGPMPLSDSTKWDTKPAGNVLAVSPEGMDPGNLTVITKKSDGTERHYFFDLVATKDGAVYGMQFTYPDDVRRERADAAQERAAQVTAQQVSARLKTDVFYGESNWRYRCKCEAGREIQPDEIRDNGMSTTFRFRGNRRPPAIYTVSRDGTETIANYTMVDDLAVVANVSELWRLRDGGAVVDIWNVGYNPVGANPQTGTISPDVVRAVRKPVYRPARPVPHPAQTAAAQ